MEKDSPETPVRVYEKPTLHHLGLLRLMTRFSFAHGGGDDSGEHGNHQHQNGHKN